MILVTGATGNVGSELVRTLVAAGEPVRGAHPRRVAPGRAAGGVEAAVGDLNRPETLDAAIDGVRGVHLLAGYAGLPEALAAHARRAASSASRCSRAARSRAAT